MRQCHRKSQSGQALVEYMLILVVSVTLIVSLSIQIFTPLQNFLKEFMGTYVSCLLETGELPNLSNPDAGTCPLASFKAGQGEGKNSPFNAKSGKESDGNEADSESSRGGNTYRGLGPRSNRSSTFSLSNSSGNSTADAAANDKGKTVQLPLGAGDEFVSRGRSESAYNFSQSVTGQKTTRTLGEATEEQKRKSRRRAGENKRSIAVDESFAPAPKKISVTPPPPKAAEKEDGQIDFGLGNWLRIIFILGIIIIVVALIGGQVAQLAKSWEK